MTPQLLNLAEQPLRLRDGTAAVLRPMTPEDLPALLGLFGSATDEDAALLRDDVRDPAVVRDWCEHLDPTRVYPLKVLVRARVVGQATLHFGCGPERHCGKVRVFVAPDYRRRGLGTSLIIALIDLARQRGLRLLLAETLSECTGLIRAAMRLGFQLCYSLPDGYMLPDGRTRNLTVLRLDLRPPCDEFGALREE